MIVGLLAWTVKRVSDEARRATSEAATARAVSDFMIHMFTSADPQKTRDEGNAAQLMGRMGTIEEAGKLCLFIAADATFTTGVDHLLTGGAELSYGRKTRKP